MEKSSTVDYTAALRQFRQYGKGRSMRQFCEDEGYDYKKFCKFSRCGAREQDIQLNKLEDRHTYNVSGSFIPIEVTPGDAVTNGTRLISQIRVSFSSGMEVTLQGSSKEEMLNVLMAL